MLRNLFLIFVLFTFSYFTALEAQVQTPSPLPEKSFSPKPEKKDLLIRRSMLEWHQIAGFVTLGLWLAANIEGEKAKDSLYRKSDEYSQLVLLTRPEYANNDPLYVVAIAQGLNQNSIAADYLLLKDPASNFPLYLALKSQEEWEAKHSGSSHKQFAYAAFGMYFLTAGLAYFAPKRIVDSEDSDVNIYSPIFAHKALIPIHLASMLLLPALGQRIEKDGPDAVRDMQQVGWIGFGAFSLSLLVITF
ncbi:hypothetical protein EHQ12_06705 [Leptospira gomenensis]|uniref:Uncharacterized protein n=1 Tax=Leptospira gomenensis TaxID=2484974 RepID=A0A5F1Z3M1_9LEPT|nr:hypothetical protein [Leptospira gomenensis]TGK33425.1 hypothetical protein EHQ17_11600 [Leptospira gomenensis]TGK40947.1 hypothetical protein EHQ12_06705 [Leptospira gomenensis]TGK46383.1 hypothetical protein EHQ07_06075 [Leptospira gomenensis]TGK67481.1 hypothetical protein EHQ13_02205 [Leptospira gomenensis]